MSQWVLKQFVARTPDEWLAMGLVYPATNRVAGTALADLSAQMASDGILISGWELLGATTLQRVQGRLWLLVVPMVGLVLLSLWLAFRRVTEVLLGVAVLLLSGLCLLTTMALAGWSWNLLNLMALPLVLGTGVDYGIFIQLALRRHGGDTRMVRRSVGRALLLCGGTAITGFGSLAWSGNAGMASLGKVCAVGIGANMLIAIFLLPAWWLWLSPKSKVQSPKSEGKIASPKTATGNHASRISSHQRINPASTLHPSIAPDCGGSDWASRGFCPRLFSTRFACSSRNATTGSTASGGKRSFKTCCRHFLATRRRHAEPRTGSFVNSL